MKRLLFMMLLTIPFAASSALAGVSHACPEDSYTIVKYEAIHRLSQDGQLSATVETEQFINKNCPNFGPGARHFHVNAEIMKTSDGLSIYPVSIGMILQTLDGSYSLMERHESQAPLRTGIRLLRGANAVEILMDGFEGLTVEL